MTTNSISLLNSLINNTEINIIRVKKLSQLPLHKLNYKISKDKWSILECIEHLNLYGNYYLPEIEKTIQFSKENPAKKFKSGILGNYFVKIMEPKAKLNAMKTFVDKNPCGSELDERVFEKFFNQQKMFRKQLEQTKKVNLSKNKITTSISKLLKLKLGDTFRFINAHNNRHILQAEKNTVNA